MAIEGEENQGKPDTPAPEDNTSGSQIEESDSGIDWAALVASGSDEGNDEYEAETPAPEAPVAAEAPPTEAVSPPAQEQPVPPVEQQQESMAPHPPEGQAAAPMAPPPVAQPQTPTPGQEQVIPQTPVAAIPQSPITPEEAQEAHNKWIQERIDVLAKEQYGLSKEVVEELDIDENFATHMSQLAARVYVDAVQSAMQGVAQQLPEVVRQVMQQTQQTTTDEDDFYGSWPGLRDNKYKDTVLRVSNVYRQVNPQAPKEQFIREVGLQTALALQLQPEALAKQLEQSPATPPAVQQQQAIEPFTPAGGGAPAVQQNNAEENPFSQIAREIEADGGFY